MNAIEWTARTLSAIPFDRKPEAPWTVNIRKLVEKHGYVTTDLVSSEYGVTREIARNRLRQTVPELGLKVLRIDRANGRGWGKPIWGRA